MAKNRLGLMAGLTLVGLIVLGQVVAFLLARESWQIFVTRLPVILAMIAFWGPIVAAISAAFIVVTMRLLGFGSLEDVRQESVEQNNPAPAIVFVGALVASLIFLGLVIRP
ncbi:MAG: hypothetical protein A2Z17_02190 [Gammaproteobacteria bacterium RBG_16_66_13]|nr:MAG: hypothetical protein A2Z17_02190 [Gammaproteobacteria bacterium RBG_16_66_13]